MRVKSFLDSFVIRDSNELVLCEKKKKKGKKNTYFCFEFWMDFASSIIVSGRVYVSLSDLK